MFAPLLTTKLYMPQAQPTDLVDRPYLLARLNEGVARPPGVILVSAPAGFGKTTLINAWLSGRMEEENLHPSSFILHPFNVAWLSLDEEDNDPAR